MFTPPLSFSLDWIRVLRDLKGHTSLNRRNILWDKEHDYFQGDDETQVSSALGEEAAELDRNAAECKKNPGHAKFIPIDTFTLKHLPEGHRHPDLLQLIKSSADLTIKVDVRIKSPDRPKFWPDTTHPYPHYVMKSETMVRHGSGMIRWVEKYVNGVKNDGSRHNKGFTKCWCRKCQTSDSPNNVWIEFDVYTATHVVFDDLEADHTSLRLFYDGNNSTWITLNNVSVFTRNVKDDLCVLKCVTCEKTLSEKLMSIWGSYDNAWIRVLYIYNQSKYVSKLIYIVSHPHGCAKRVSIGKWKKKSKSGKYKYKYSYTTCTCPGSSGAYVHCVGYTSGWKWHWVYQLVHCGSKPGYNYSGTGVVM